VWIRFPWQRETTDGLQEIAETTAGVLVQAALSPAVKRSLQFREGPSAPGWPSGSFERTHGPKHQTLRMANWILVFDQPTGEGGKILNMG
jgi:hypothetical protein